MSDTPFPVTVEQSVGAYYTSVRNLRAHSTTVLLPDSHLPRLSEKSPTPPTLPGHCISSKSSIVIVKLSTAFFANSEQTVA